MHSVHILTQYSLSGSIILKIKKHNHTYMYKVLVVMNFQHSNIVIVENGYILMFQEVTVPFQVFMSEIQDQIHIKMI